MAGKNDWQEEGIRLAGMLVDAVEIIHAALPYIRDRRHRKELEQFLTSSGRGPLPSGEALHALETAVIAVMMRTQKERRRQPQP